MKLQNRDHKAYQTADHDAVADRELITNLQGDIKTNLETIGQLRSRIAELEAAMKGGDDDK